MAYSFPSDVEQRLKTQLALGFYSTEDDVLRAALSALEREQEDLAAIQDGIDDMQAGRYRSFAEIDEKFRRKYNIARNA